MRLNKFVFSVKSICFWWHSITHPWYNQLRRRYQKFNNYYYAISWWYWQRFVSEKKRKKHSPWHKRHNDILLWVWWWSIMKCVVFDCELLRFGSSCVMFLCVCVFFSASIYFTISSTFITKCVYTQLYCL